MLRRGFAKTTALATGALLLPRGGRAQSAADAHIEVLRDEPIATIAPEMPS